MSTSTNMHGMERASFQTGATSRWLHVGDKDGNSVCIFLHNLDQINALDRAIDAARQAFPQSETPEPASGPEYHAPAGAFEDMGL